MRPASGVPIRTLYIWFRLIVVLLVLNILYYMYECDLLVYWWVVTFITHVLYAVYFLVFVGQCSLCATTSLDTESNVTRQRDILVSLPWQPLSWHHQVLCPWTWPWDAGRRGFNRNRWKGQYCTLIDSWCLLKANVYENHLYQITLNLILKFSILIFEMLR